MSQAAVLADVARLFNRAAERPPTSSEILLLATQTGRVIQEYEANLDNVKVKIYEETFDRAHELNLTPGDYCHDGITALYGVRIWFYARVERGLLFGGDHPVRLLGVFGDRVSIFAAHKLYQLVDTNLTHEIMRFRRTDFFKRAKSSIQAMETYQKGICQRTNDQLSQIAANLNDTMMQAKKARISMAFDQAGFQLKNLSGKNLPHALQRVALSKIS